MWIEIMVLVGFVWIAYFDIRWHLIRNIDLAILLVIQSLLYFNNFLVAINAVLIYLGLNLLSRGKIGAGDVKFSYLCALPLSTFNEILNAISITWIAGGLIAVVSRSNIIPFAPFMILGTYIEKIW